MSSRTRPQTSIARTIGTPVTMEDENSQIEPSSQRAAAQDNIELNWILFDKTEPAPLLIPRNLYERASAFCQKLFADELRTGFGIVVKEVDVEFWKPKEKLKVEDVMKDGWRASLGNFKDTFEKISLASRFSTKKLELDDWQIVHLVVTTTEGRSFGMQAVDELREFKQYSSTVATRGKPPSQGAEANVYPFVQADANQVIYDGRTPVQASFPTVAPPIHIFHPVFDAFSYFLDDPSTQPTSEDRRNVHKLMNSMCTIYPNEDWHQHYIEILLKYLRIILDADIVQEINSDGTAPDAVIRSYVHNDSVPLGIMELKRELGEASCDPSTQAGLSMKRFWIQDLRKPLREKCCCPTFLLAGGGPWLTVLGGVFTDKVIVQRLTDMKWMAISSTEEDARVYHNARVLIALRQSLSRLRAFYTTGLGGISSFIPRKPHPRYFPYATSFIDKTGAVVRFQYLGSMEPDAACVTYLAEIIPTTATMTPKKVVVKYVARYGVEAHLFLGNEGHAPALLYYGRLPGSAGLSNISSTPAIQAAPPGLCLRSDVMHMVVMEYIDALPKSPTNAHAQIKTVLRKMHSEGYVFGDLREQNILFDANGNVKLIDFNWCGRYDVSVLDEGLPDGLQESINANMEHIQARGGSYAHYLLSMSDLDGMWAPGMCGLAPIRPIHDWRMLEKLPLEWTL